MGRSLHLDQRELLRAQRHRGQAVDRAVRAHGGGLPRRIRTQS